MPCPHAVTSKALPAAAQMKGKQLQPENQGLQILAHNMKTEGLSLQIFPTTLFLPFTYPQQYTHKEISISNADYYIPSEALDYTPVSPTASPYGLHCSLYFTLT